MPSISSASAQRFFVFAIFIAASEAIINGTVVPLGKYPFMVSLQWDKKHKCGGTLVDEFTVLTVAHCKPLIFVERDQPQRVSVLAGSVNQANPSGSDYRRVGVRKIIWLPEFPQKYRGHFLFKEDKEFPEITQMDYLILKLNASIPQTPTIGYALLANAQRQPRVNDICYGPGWGRYKSPDNYPLRANVFSDKLLEARLKIVANSICWEFVKEDELNLCIRQVVVNGRSMGTPCFGDSGSPLVCKDDQGQDYVAAMARAALIPCNAPLSESEYINIAPMADWIKQSSNSSPQTSTNKSAFSVICVLQAMFLIYFYLTDYIY